MVMCSAEWQCVWSVIQAVSCQCVVSGVTWRLKVKWARSLSWQYRTDQYSCLTVSDMLTIITLLALATTSSSLKCLSCVSRNWDKSAIK